MTRAIRLFRKLLKFGMPLYLILAPVVALSGWVTPWGPAEGALLKYQGQSSVLVGASYRSHYSLGLGQTITSSRSYILIPAALSDPKIITFTQENGGAVTVQESRLALVFMLLWLILCCVGTWWFWFRQVPPNNSLKPKQRRDTADNVSTLTFEFSD